LLATVPRTTARAGVEVARPCAARLATFLRPEEAIPGAPSKPARDPSEETSQTDEAIAESPKIAEVPARSNGLFQPQIRAPESSEVRGTQVVVIIAGVFGMHVFLSHCLIVRLVPVQFD